jgi:hypothetical protein
VAIFTAPFGRSSPARFQTRRKEGSDATAERRSKSTRRTRLRNDLWEAQLPERQKIGPEGEISEPIARGTRGSVVARENVSKHGDEVFDMGAVAYYAEVILYVDRE